MIDKEKRAIEIGRNSFATVLEKNEKNRRARYVRTRMDKLLSSDDHMAIEAAIAAARTGLNEATNG